MPGDGLDGSVCSTAAPRHLHTTLRGQDGNSALLAQGSSRLVVTEGPGVREFLDTHGEGVADIAFGCDNVDATIASGVAAGARPLRPALGNPALPGVGGVRHTLLPVSR